MNAQILRRLNAAAQIALLLTALMLTVWAQGAEPRLAPSLHAPSASAVEISPAVYANPNLSEDRIPLAREDVVPLQTAVAGGSTTTPVEDAQAKISGRYTDAKMLGFLSRTSLQQLLTVYREASQMIDARHVNPPAYEVRTRAAVEDVITALNNPQFLKASSANPQPQALASVQNQLRQMLQTQPARDLNQALALMQSTAEVVARGTGVRREAAALEFLNGTLDALDKYSAFLPEAAGGSPGAMTGEVRTAGLEENMVGIGVELKTHPQGVEIVGVIDNSPAAEVGLQEGDVIIAVGSQNVGGQTLNEIADRLTGPSGSSVTIDILRGGQKYRGTLVRRKIYVSSVTGVKMLDPASKLGYIRLKQFSESSAKDLESALWTLHNQGMKGLVFDLRGNPGGLLNVCVEISDMFIPCGTIVSTKGRNMDDNSKETARYEKTWNVPLVVLVDENSASASEIFAAAIQDNQRGVIIGRHSYGKGTVQTHFPMRSVPAVLKLTTAKFDAPSGRDMAGAGVTPDVPVNYQPANYRGTDNDVDVQTALQVLAQGTPSQLASLSATCRKPGAPLNTAPLTGSAPARAMPSDVREY